MISVFPLFALNVQYGLHDRLEADHVLFVPTFAQASSKTIAGVDAQQLQEDVRAAEAAMQQSEMEQIQSLDDLLDSFAPTDGRR